MEAFAAVKFVSQVHARSSSGEQRQPHPTYRRAIANHALPAHFAGAAAPRDRLQRCPLRLPRLAATAVGSRCSTTLFHCYRSGGSINDKRPGEGRVNRHHIESL
jgi:hypothetical protein